MPPEPKSKRPTIECAQNGPYLVKNLETFENSYGDEISPHRTMALCRCGASKNKPYFAEFARICGGHGTRVVKAGELDDAIGAAIAHEGPALVEVISDAELI